ncbi:MAG: hypothetical protein HQM14_10505 [SAR324 cluster bacterium]|nr:hypothetical protein [SAR324 cluster bacterium]
MKRILIILMVAWCLLFGNAYAQETGSLMMSVEIGYTLGGMIGGAAVGGVVWLTDPGGPTSIGSIVKDGAVLGTLLGAIAGYYLLYNAAVSPGQALPMDNIDDLLGRAYGEPDVVVFSQTHLLDRKKMGLSVTLINQKF